VVHARPEYRSGAAHRAGQAINVPLTIARRGLLWPWRPLRATRQLTALLHWGTTLAGGLVAAAARDPERTALVDDLGALTYAELDARTDRLAAALIPDRRGRRRRVAVLCRNHRGLVESLIACSKRGAEVVLLGTGLGPAQLHSVMRELWADIIIADAEFADLLPLGTRQVTKVTAWPEGPGEGRWPTLDELIEAAPARGIEPPSIQGRTVFLSSGTSGRPKGARRPPRPGFVPLAAMLARTPLRVGDRMLIEAPLFHAWGYSSLQLALAMRATVVIGRRMDPELTLRTIQHRRCTTLITVPIVLQRILGLPASTRAAYDTSSLRLVAVSGSRLPGDLATAFMDAFPVELCNVYGSTEAGWVSIATAADLRAHPDTAGRPATGAVVAILDAQGDPVPRGATGRIYAACSGRGTRFEGYTGGLPVETRDGMLFMGDVGHIDDDGLLYVDGRADEMIVSGGENVFPGAAEDVIARLPQVREVAVTGVTDPEYGERLAAYVVTTPGAGLDAETVRGHVRAQLARYAVPRDVYFPSRLPRNAMGKVVPDELREAAGA
jgi:acyl-CoA synthetase (AMP-forming)/AMP-acid ligase II